MSISKTNAINSYFFQQHLDLIHTYWLYYFVSNLIFEFIFFLETSGSLEVVCRFIIIIIIIIREGIQNIFYRGKKGKATKATNLAPKTAKCLHEQVYRILCQIKGKICCFCCRLWLARRRQSPGLVFVRNILIFLSIMVRKINNQI